MKLSPIAVVAFDQISPFHLAVPCVVFGDRHPGLEAFDFKVCGINPGPLRTTAGFSIHAAYGLEALNKAQTIIVPSWRDPSETPPGPLLKALVAAEERGARLVGLCLGAYVLAAAGLLDGRRATTHWAYAKDFARRYPKILVDADVLYVEDGKVLTSAGTAAGLDCCLHLLRQSHGAELANRVARRLVVSPHRQGGQAQFIVQPVPQHPQDVRLAPMMDWVRENLHLRHSLEQIAQKANMSRRTLTRHFHQLTGSSFKQWLLNERLIYSQRLLEQSDHSIEVIAQMAGLGAAVSLRHHFRQALGISPSAWRLAFKGRGEAAGT